jgi:DNA excision repair protein ERCC-2
VERAVTAPRQYTVAVRALCEFTAKQGDLDLRFTPSPSAQEGIAGHAVVQGRRPASYQSEVTLAGEYRHLRVRGRADGYDPDLNRLEEIKTFRGDLERQPANHRHLHWAQAKVYGHLLCEKLDLEQIEIALVYYDIGSQRETVIAETHACAPLKAYFEAQCERFLAWAASELAHRGARDEALAALPFPHADFRPGQRQLAEAVYKANLSGRCLLAQAPTGIGKTVGTLFPMLRAAPGQKLDKIFFLAAKTSGRRMALDALDMLTAGAPRTPLRVLEMVARDKACEHPDLACHGDACPLAQGFYDRLPAARSAAVAAGNLEKDALRAIALAHQVCPYYLSQDLTRWVDVVVGDYNYYFDGGALLYNLTVLNGWTVSVLADEAHNLVSRARRMYSSELDQRQFDRLRAGAPKPLKKPLGQLARSWDALHAAQEQPYQVYPEVPEKFQFALQQAAAAITDYFTENPTVVEPALQEFYFEAMQFARLLEDFGPHTLFDVEKAGDDAVVTLRNVVPAHYLAPRFAASRASVLFSATLSPWEFYVDMLGLPPDTVWIDVDSPFAARQLHVSVHGAISTRYRDRDASLAPVAALMARQYEQQPGNYLAFFSSFDYLQKAIEAFRARHPDIPVWEQERRMDEAAQAAFLARFTHDSRGIGFAVLGGSFAEGIDLPGRRLIGAFIATLGLPQVNPVNEEIMRRMAALFGREHGYDYTYLFPGLQKVVQAAGRVIRTSEDEGVVHLIDDRFGQARVRRLLPAWWHVGTRRE